MRGATGVKEFYNIGGKGHTNDGHRRRLEYKGPRPGEEVGDDRDCGLGEVGVFAAGFWYECSKFRVG